MSQENNSLALSIKVDIYNLGQLNESHQYNKLIDVDRESTKIADGQIQVSNASLEQTTFTVLDEETVTITTGQSAEVSIMPEPYTTTYKIQLISASYIEMLEL